MNTNNENTQVDIYNETRENRGIRLAAELVGASRSISYKPCGTYLCPGARAFICIKCKGLFWSCPCGDATEFCCGEEELPHEACIYFHYGRPYKLECIHTNK